MSDQIAAEAAALLDPSSEGLRVSAHDNVSVIWENTRLFANLLYLAELAVQELKESDKREVLCFDTREFPSDDLETWKTWIEAPEIAHPSVSIGEDVEKKHTSRYGIDTETVKNDDFEYHFRVSVFDRKRFVEISEEFIGEEPTDEENLEALNKIWMRSSPMVKQDFLDEIGQDNSIATPKGPWSSRVRPAHKTADVELPDSPPELWDPVGYTETVKELRALEEGSKDYKNTQGILAEKFKDLPKEHQNFITGEQKPDDALISFTKRVWGPWLRADKTGAALNDLKADKPLHSELVKAQKRLRGRGSDFPDDCPLPSLPERNRALIAKIEKGELLPPTDSRLNATLAQASGRLKTEAVYTSR